MMKRGLLIIAECFWQFIDITNLKVSSFLEFFCSNFVCKVISCEWLFFINHFVNFTDFLRSTFPYCLGCDTPASAGLACDVYVDAVGIGGRCL